MFFRAFNRINRATTIGRRASSSSIPIQNPNLNVGLDYIKATFKWENFPLFVVAVAFAGDIVYINLQGKATATSV